ncbi:MAG: aryl-sulfate sulfotransferase [Bacteroidetes bacterium]|nr:aryl-sulfate sulfotransferase [Bacteroidota bacterium]
MRKLSYCYLIVLVFFINNKITSQQWDGLTYYSNSNSTIGRLVDTNSATIKTYNFTGGTGYSTHFLPGGDFYRSVVNSGNVLSGGGMTGRIQKLDYNGTILWDYTYSSSTYCLHHDICPMPNGNVLVISYDVKTATDVTNAGGTFVGSMWSEKIMELKPVGTNSAVVVWEWKVWDHLVQNVNSSAANYQTSIVNNPQLLNINYSAKKDWLHMNGVDYNPILDQIAISSHNLNEWYIIDHSTTTAEAASHIGGNSNKGGDILYRWGNPAAYSAPGSTILNVTHDVHWVKEGIPSEGDLVGVNNRGVTSPSSKTTIDKITSTRVNYNYSYTAGTAFLPTTYNARHTSTGYSSNMGSSNQFPNGNQMICLAMLGSIYEINSAGTILWTLNTSGSCAQSHRYSLCYLTNPAPSQPTISLSGIDLVSTPATTYQWYVNGNLIPAATNQTITPSTNGVYVVRTTDVNGCVYVYSAGYLVGQIPTGITSYQKSKQLIIYPNPSNGIFNILNNNPLITQINYTIYDLSGKQIINQKNNSVIDLTDYQEGIYIVKIQTNESQVETFKLNNIK